MTQKLLPAPDRDSAQKLWSYLETFGQNCIRIIEDGGQWKIYDTFNGVVVGNGGSLVEAVANLQNPWDVEDK